MLWLRCLPQRGHPEFWHRLISKGYQRTAKSVFWGPRSDCHINGAQVMARWARERVRTDRPCFALSTERWEGHDRVFRVSSSIEGRHLEMIYGKAWAVLLSAI